jgi:glucose/arabinose dehydrogenase
VAESNAPAKPEDGQGLRGWIMKKVMARAGSGGTSANRITLLRDSDGDGTLEDRSVFLEGLNSPFGMALIGDQLYVANTDALVRFPYKQGATRIDAAGEKVVDLPAGPINHHWTKNVIASHDGSRLYVTSGSNSNVGENGMEAEENRAAILEIDPHDKTMRLFASGLRNPNGLAWQPDSGELWTTVNERDEIGSDLVPDYMTSVQDGGFYGWPYSYYGQHVDERVKPPRPDLVAKALMPDYALGAHTASLGLAFYEGSQLPERYRHGAFIGQHGSWNRKPRSGYKVVFVPFKDGEPDGTAEDVLTGFLNEDEQAMGRPVGVAVDKAGALDLAGDTQRPVKGEDRDRGPSRSLQVCLLNDRQGTHQPDLSRRQFDAIGQHFDARLHCIPQRGGVVRVDLAGRAHGIDSSEVDAIQLYRPYALTGQHRQFAQMASATGRHRIGKGRDSRISEAQGHAFDFNECRPGGIVQAEIHAAALNAVRYFTLERGEAVQFPDHSGQQRLFDQSIGPCRVDAGQPPLRGFNQFPGARQLAFGIAVALKPDARALAHAIEHRAGIRTVDAQVLAGVGNDIGEEALVAPNQPTLFQRRCELHQPFQLRRPRAMRSTACSSRGKFCV